MHSRPRRPRWALLVLAVAGALAAVVALVRQAERGDVLDPSTPREQNGFAILAAQPSGRRAPERDVLAWVRLWAPRPLRVLLPDAHSDVPDALGLAVALPGNGIVPGPNGFAVSADRFAATARASTGDTFPLPCSTYGLSSGRAGVFLFVYLPPGYPHTYRWLDVRVVDQQGAAATWRLRALPRLVHAIPSPVRVSDTAWPLPGVVVQARAWWDPKRVAAAVARKPGGPPFPDNALSLTAQIEARGLPNVKGVHWNLDIADVQSEWEPPQGHAIGDGENDVGRKVQTASRESSAAPTPAVQRWAKVHATLTETMYYEEPVTFRNLPIQRAGAGYRITGRHAATSLHFVVVEISPSLEKPSAPNEITFVARTLGAGPGNVRSFSFHIVGPTSAGGSNMASSEYFNDEHRIMLRHPLANGRRLSALTFEISQETVGRTIPMTFVVPVVRGRPVSPRRAVPERTGRIPRTRERLPASFREH